MNTEVAKVNTTNGKADNTEQMNILICPSKRSLEHAQNLKTALAGWANADVWQEVFSDTSVSSVPDFCNKLMTYDLSVFLLREEDIKTMNEGELSYSQSEFFQNITASFAYIGRTNTLVATEIKDMQDFLFLVATQPTVTFPYDYTKPIEELAARIEWHCSENNYRWNTKKRSDMHATNAIKEQSLRAELARTRDSLNYVKFNEFTEPKPDVSGELILRYEFPVKYVNGTSYEFLLLKRGNKTILTDQGRTYAILDKTFEMSEPDVMKNINAIMKQYDVSTVKDSYEYVLEISSWDDNPDEDQNVELKEAIFRLYGCITFMDNMKIFYV